jgi:hypothetical protein
MSQDKQLLSSYIVARIKLSGNKTIIYLIKSINVGPQT